MAWGVGLSHSAGGRCLLLAGAFHAGGLAAVWLFLFCSFVWLYDLCVWMYALAVFSAGLLPVGS